MDKKILLVAFYNGVTSDLFIHKRYKPQTMAELIRSAQSLMNAEDANIAKRKKNTEQMEAGCMHHPK